MENIYKLLPKYFNNQCTPEEIQVVKLWEKDCNSEFRELKSIWELTKEHQYINFDSEASWEELKARLKKEKQNTLVFELLKWGKLLAAAVVILITVWGGLQLFDNQSSDVILTSEESEGYSSTFRGLNLVSKNAVEKTNLTNGAFIWLKQNSKIEDLGYINSRYEVKLHQGEVFFEIKSSTKNNYEPFVVYTENASVSVTEAQFSVSTTPSQTIITVVEGNAKIITGKINQLSLSIGEKAIVYNGKIKKIENPSINEVAWRTGKFEFVNTPLADLILLLESFYKVKIDLISDFKVSYTGNFDNNPIDEVISTITKATNLRFEEVDADNYYIISSK